jgi:predicted ATPase/class 3 adenylate cyclase
MSSLPTEKAIPGRPSGTVTFLFTDIEGSTFLWEHQPEAMQQAFDRQEAIIRQSMAAHDGYVYKMVGDAFQVAFSTAPAAVAAALDAQRLLQAEAWGEIGNLKVRMALHTCITEERGEDYLGPDLNRIARILSAAHGRQVLLSQAVYELVRDHLPPGTSLRDLGLHYLKDIINPEHLYQLCAPELPDDFPALNTLTPPASLPQQTTPFIGRETELAQIEALLTNPECRLVTLVGVGGTGKTRLAIQFIEQSRIFMGNAFYIELAAVTKADGLVSAIAEAVKLSFHTQPGELLNLEQAQAQLSRYLASKRALLVLDNFEQLISCAEFLSDLLTSAPGIKLLVTSRERLNLPGEWTLEVLGLPFPSQQDVRAILQYPAAQLFVKGAERTGYLVADKTDWPAIARICQLLEGLPLGIEMASTWVKMLSCQEIAAEIELDRDFLAANWRGVPERQRSLRAVFESSWRLLSSQERDVFCRLSVFHAGFTRVAALEVSGAPLALLAALVDKSFVRRLSAGRFEVHPVLKQYASEKLAADASVQIEVQNHHAHYYSTWLEGLFEKLKGNEQLSALATLRLEMLNLRAAWQTLVEQRDFARLEKLLPAIILFFEMNNQHVEIQHEIQMLSNMQRSLRQVFEITAEADLNDMQKASYQGLLAFTLAVLHRYTLDYSHPEQNASLQQESLQLVHNLPDSSTKAFVYLVNNIGPSTLPPQASLELCQQSVLIFRRLGDAWGAALAQLILADLNIFEKLLDIELARIAYQDSLDAFLRWEITGGRLYASVGWPS